MCFGLSAGMMTSKIHATATTPASVGVNQPVRMPPSRMIGIISGRAASLAASAIMPKEARVLLAPSRPEKIAIDHQAEADHQARHDAAMNRPAIDTLPTAP